MKINVENLDSDKLFYCQLRKILDFMSTCIKYLHVFLD